MPQTMLINVSLTPHPKVQQHLHPSWILAQEPPAAKASATELAIANHRTLAPTAMRTGWSTMAEVATINMRNAAMRAAAKVMAAMPKRAEHHRQWCHEAYCPTLPISWNDRHDAATFLVLGRGLGTASLGVAARCRRRHRSVRPMPRPAAFGAAECSSASSLDLLLLRLGPLRGYMLLHLNRRCLSP